MYVGFDEPGEQACPYSDLDEYLCEYVDGEMDPDVRAVFEEILTRDPALMEHVECLRQTRAMLGAFGQGIGSPCGFQARLRVELSREVAAEQPLLLATATGPLRRAAAFASILALAVVAGLNFVETEDHAPLAVTQEAGVHTVPAGEAIRTPLYWSAAPVVVPAGFEHQRFSFGQMPAALTHTLHTKAELEATLLHTHQRYGASGSLSAP